MERIVLLGSLETILAWPVVACQTFFCFASRRRRRGRARPRRLLEEDGADFVDPKAGKSVRPISPFRSSAACGSPARRARVRHPSRSDSGWKHEPVDEVYGLRQVGLSPALHALMSLLIGLTLALVAVVLVGKSRRARVVAGGG